MKMAPAGARAKELENEHDLSSNTWNVTTPMNDHMSSSSQIYVTSEGRKSSAQSGGTDIPIQHTGNIHPYSRTNSSSGMLKTGKKGGSDERMANQRKSSSKPQTDRKSVRFDRKNSKGINKQAKHIVDDAISRALKMLYGPSRKQSSRSQSIQSLNTLHHQQHAHNQQNVQKQYHSIHNEHNNQLMNNRNNTQNTQVVNTQDIMNNVHNQRNVHEHNIEHHLTKTTVIHPESQRRGHRSSHGENKAKQGTYDIGKLFIISSLM